MPPDEPPQTASRARVELRPAEPADAPDILALLSEPEVERWWGKYTLDDVRDELEGTFVVLVDGAPAGWLHAHEETDPDHASVAFDIALRTALHGQGHGRAALRLAIDRFAARGHHRFTIDPATENARAIRAYAAVGFRPVGVLRRYERGPDGRWRDGLLMDLLTEDLADAPA
jgi:aminoglycoside 6'-N-acetyltransferase